MTTDTNDTDRIVLASDVEDRLTVESNHGLFDFDIRVGSSLRTRASVIGISPANVAAMGRRLLALVGEAAPAADGGDDLPGVPSPYTEGARLMLAAEVPVWWEWHWRNSADWSLSTPVDSMAFDSTAFVEARPAAPVMVTIDAADLEAVAEHLDASGHPGHAIIARSAAAMIADAKAGQ